jgi:ssDNA-binding Zn-finger/Zn-ribbon topoisomerase 1
MEDTKNIIGEAPASATLSVVTPKGYNTLFTLREMSGEMLLKKISALESKLETLGYKPQVKSSGFPKKEVEYVPGKSCPKCGGRLILKKKSDGTPFHQCENKKWNSFTKQNEGTCDFTDWLNPKVTFNKQSPYSGKTMTVDDYENLGPEEEINL